MTYQETLDWMFAQLPMYHRIGAAAYKADLQPTFDLMAALGHPERKFRSIHVAGTNGKGSVSHFLASILQEAGYKVGLYTSPHLVDFRERIRINGEMISKDEVVRFIDNLRGTASLSEKEEAVHLSFFEMTVGMAFDYFAREQVDVAVIEVGMGGRLDSTNVITPLLSIITNIGLDHTQFLGDTLEKIAGEKAGIIKDEIPVVIGETQPETAPVFRSVATLHHAPITFADQHYHVIEENGKWMVASLRPSEKETKGAALSPELTGEYQKKNIATVLEAVDMLRNTTDFNLTPAAVQRGIARVVTNTHLHGRWQTIGTAPLTICETAHNEPGIRAMVGKLRTMQFRHLHLIYGCVNDKDFSSILRFLHSQLTDSIYHLTWYFTQPSVPRGLPVAALQASAEANGIHGAAYERVEEALAAARREAQFNDLVLVTGSIFLVADALAFTISGEASES